MRDGQREHMAAKRFTVVLVVARSDASCRRTIPRGIRVCLSTVKAIYIYITKC